MTMVLSKIQVETFCVRSTSWSGFLLVSDSSTDPVSPLTKSVLCGMVGVCCQVSGLTGCRGGAPPGGVKELLR